MKNDNWHGESISVDEQFWEGKNPEEYIARQYVGAATIELTLHNNSREVYRVGLTPKGELIADRVLVDPFFQSEEPAGVAIDDVPDAVWEELFDSWLDDVPLEDQLRIASEDQVIERAYGCDISL
ncbi:hypothetical protein EXS54_00750 [Patescibacteria group bacterium]|nr:hypothetical protein [Patescibacteria group bacterium]